MFRRIMAELVGEECGVSPAEVLVVENEPCSGLFDVVATWVKDGLSFVATAVFVSGFDKPLGDIRIANPT